MNRTSLFIRNPYHNGFEQVFEGGDTQLVTRLYQSRRTDERLPVVIREDQMQMVTYRLN